MVTREGVLRVIADTYEADDDHDLPDEFDMGETEDLLRDLDVNHFCGLVEWANWTRFDIDDIVILANADPYMEQCDWCDVEQIYVNSDKADVHFQGHLDQGMAMVEINGNEKHFCATCCDGPLGRLFY